MRYRQLGRSGLRVSVLTMGTMTFGGKGGFAALLRGAQEPPVEAVVTVVVNALAARPTTWR